MRLLDSLVAFALTLAALATVVTIITEVISRALGMRARNLVQVLKLLNAQLKGGDDGAILGLTPRALWQFIEGVAIDPARAALARQDGTATSAGPPTAQPAAVEEQEADLDARLEVLGHRGIR